VIIFLSRVNSGVAIFSNMQVIDRIASSGYSYVSPTVDRACNVVPLLGGFKQRIEPYAHPLIQNADTCIDTVYGMVDVRAAALRSAATCAGTTALNLKHSAYIVVEERAIALRDVVTSTGDKAQKMIGESPMVARAHKTSLAIVDTLDMLIDRYLPEPQAKDGKDDTKDNTPEDLIPRVLHMPFKIPVRMMHISIAKARNGCDVIQVRIQWASQLTSDQKAKLQALIFSRSQAIVDKVSSSSLAITLRQGKQRVCNMSQIALQSIDDGRKAVEVKCYIVYERFHVIETRDWALKTVGALPQATMERASDIFVAYCQRGYDVTSFVVGQDRAMAIFAFVGKRLPFVKIAIHSSASTGALSDSSSHDVEQKIESSTGATGKAPQPTIEIPSKQEGSAVQEDEMSP